MYQINILTEKRKWGRILGQAVGPGEKYWVGVNFIQGCISISIYLTFVFRYQHSHLLTRKLKSDLVTLFFTVLNTFSQNLLSLNFLQCIIHFPLSTNLASFFQQYLLKEIFFIQYNPFTPKDKQRTKGRVYNVGQLLKSN